MHTFQEKMVLLNHVREIRGQIEEVEKILEEEHCGPETLKLLASVREAVNGLTGDIIEDYIRHHFLKPSDMLDLESARSVEWLVFGMRSCFN